MSILTGGETIKMKMTNLREKSQAQRFKEDSHLQASEKMLKMILLSTEMTETYLVVLTLLGLLLLIGEMMMTGNM